MRLARSEILSSRGKFVRDCLWRLSSFARHRERRKDDASARVVHLPLKPSRLRDDYLSLFSFLPLDIEFLLLAPEFHHTFPLSLSPSIFSVYSTVISSPVNFRTAEKVKVSSFSFRSLTFVSSSSRPADRPGEVVPVFLDLQGGCPLLSTDLISHFHVPTGSTALSSAAPVGRILRTPTPLRESNS